MLHITNMKAMLQPHLYIITEFYSLRNCFFLLPCNNGGNKNFIGYQSFVKIVSFLDTLRFGNKRKQFEHAQDL